MESLESVLAGVPFFSHLRPDERARVALRLSVVRLAAGSRRAFAASLRRRQRRGREAERAPPG
jgi:hypothetical protein